MGAEPAAVLRALEGDDEPAAIPGAVAVDDGISALEAARPDLLAEVAKSPRDGEPGLSYMRWALERDIPIATSDKWPVATAGVALAAAAREAGVGFRAESTVMSGTPVLSALTTGIAGATPVRLRGIVNATVNQICTDMDDGSAYEDALAEAQSAGLAEPDPAEDVDGLDAVAKLMILSALVFGDQLREVDVDRRGISTWNGSREEGTRLREVATLDPGTGSRSVAVAQLERGDPHFDVVGSENAIRLEAEPLGAVTVRGPGAGPALAGQGVMSDVIALIRELDMSRGRR